MTSLSDRIERIFDSRAGRRLLADAEREATDALFSQRLELAKKRQDLVAEWQKVDKALAEQEADSRKAFETVDRQRNAAAAKWRRISDERQRRRASCEAARDALERRLRELTPRVLSDALRRLRILSGGRRYVPPGGFGGIDPPRLLTREEPTGRIDALTRRPQTKLLTNRRALEAFYTAIDSAMTQLEELQYQALSEQELRQKIDEIFGSLPDWRQMGPAKSISEYLQEAMQ